jgi:hypothetical protein
MTASGETAVPASIRRPKKRGPFQAVPVIARAMLGEAGISRLAPDIALCNDGDGVPLALVFAQEHGAGFEAPRAKPRTGDGAGGAGSRESLWRSRSGTTDALFPEEVQSFPDNFSARLGQGSVDNARG